MMTNSYLEGFSEMAEAWGVDPQALYKIAVGIPDGGASAYGVGQDVRNVVSPIAGGTATAGIGTALAGLGSSKLAPALVVGGAGAGVGALGRRLADTVTEGAVTRGLERFGDRIGRWYARKFGPNALGTR